MNETNDIIDSVLIDEIRYLKKYIMEQDSAWSDRIQDAKIRLWRKQTLYLILHHPEFIRLTVDIKNRKKQWDKKAKELFDLDISVPPYIDEQLDEYDICGECNHGMRADGLAPCNKCKGAGVVFSI